MDFVPVMHEQTAGFAAMGFTAATGVPSICLLSSGVGSTNAISPLVCAWQDQLPILFISGQNFSSTASALKPTTKRTYGEQELNLGSIVESLTKKFVIVNNPDTFESSFTSALAELNEGRPGPVWVDVPLDYQSAKVNALGLSGESRDTRAAMDKVQIGQFERLVQSANRPVILLGPSLNLHPDKSNILKALEDVGLPVVYEPGAESLFPRFHGNSFGPVGTMGCDPRALAVLESADLVIGIGALLRISLTGNNPEHFLPGTTFLIFDYDSSEIPEPLCHRSYFMGAPSLEAISSLRNERGRYKDWALAIEKIKRGPTEPNEPKTDQPGLDLHSLSEILCDAAEDDAIFVTDSGFCEVILPTNSRLVEGQTWVHPFSQGSMGYGTGAALGVANAFPRRQIVLIVGDGSLMMNLQDLHSIVSSHLNIKVLVVANDMYGIIRLRQADLFRGRLIGVDQSSGIASPDWPSLIVGLGIRFVDLIDHPVSKDSLASALAASGPTVVRLKGSPHQNYWVPHVTTGHPDSKSFRVESNPFLQVRSLRLSQIRAALA